VNQGCLGGLTQDGLYSGRNSCCLRCCLVTVARYRREVTRGSLTSRRDENATGAEKGTLYGWVSRVLNRHKWAMCEYWSSTGVAMGSMEYIATVTTVIGIEVYRAQSFTRSLSAIYKCCCPQLQSVQALWAHCFLTHHTSLAAVC
jgi:hypothetical protein